MTADTDALRLVPVNARDLDALRYVLNRADEASRIRTVMSTFTLPERETTAERLERLYATLKAAAPAVQPAAGKPVARKHSDKCWGRTSFSDEMAHCYCPRPIGWTNQVALDAARDHPKEAAWMWGAPNGSINIPLYAHPPAQGSESGGEPVEYNPFRHDGFYVHEDGNRLCWMRDGTLSFWVPYEPASNAALSPQPGPASEGDGE